MELQIAYIGLSILMTIILIFLGIKTIDKTYREKSKIKKKKVLLISFLIIWHLYLFILASTEFMLNLKFPPRFFILTILPLFIFTGIFIYKNRNNSWIQNIPPHWLFFYQTFRIFIEVIFVFTVAKGILHPNVTIEGYNFDMVYAFTVLIIGLIVFKKIIRYKRLIIWWNYLGLGVIAIIIFLFQSTIYIPEIYGDIKPFSSEFLNYPYILVPSFLMPTAVFIHILSIVQLRKMSVARTE
ncbi:MAG: hypothetical protein O6943_00340 [Bacteroidetes bacterium]|nr:hypothetical protein [Bacteroidota bacterium]